MRHKLSRLAFFQPLTVLVPVPVSSLVCTNRLLRVRLSFEAAFPTLKGPLNNQVKVFPWHGPDQSLRQVLEWMVQTKEVWAAALTGSSMPVMDDAPREHRTPSAMLARMQKADAAFHSVLTNVRNRSAWEDTFVDALCEAPGDLYLWRYVRARDYVQFLPPDARDGCPATPRSKCRRFWLS